MSDLLIMLLPGTMYLWVLFIAQGPMQEILHEKDSRILGRILAAPVTVSQFVLAKMARSYLLCSGALLALVAVSRLLFGVRWGSPVLLAAIIAAAALSMTGQLACVYSLARTREQANVISSLIILALAMVGGSMFPFENLPGFLQAIGQWTPNRWAVIALQGAARGKPFLELMPAMAGLVMIGGVGSILALVLFQRQLGQGRAT